MYLEPGGIFGADSGAVEIAAKHINRRLVVLLVAVADFVTVVWNYSWTVIGAAAAAAAAMIAANTYLSAFLATPAYKFVRLFPTYPLLCLV